MYAEEDALAALDAALPVCCAPAALQALRGIVAPCLPPEKVQVGDLPFFFRPFSCLCSGAAWDRGPRPAACAGAGQRVSFVISQHHHRHTCMRTSSDQHAACSMQCLMTRAAPCSVGVSRVT